VPTLDVVMGAGVRVRLVATNVNGPPAAPMVIFCTATVAVVAVFTVLESVQRICAAATIFAAGMVTTLPAKVPKLAGFPVTAEFVSVQLTEVAVNLVPGFSVMVTAVLSVVTFIAVGDAGVAVFTVEVVMDAGAEARFVAVYVNAPPIAPTVTFCSATVAALAVLVNVHVMASP
jgi:hypothetical protein